MKALSNTAFPLHPFPAGKESWFTGVCGHRHHTMTLTLLAGRKEATPEFTNRKAIFKHDSSLIVDGQGLTIH